MSRHRGMAFFVQREAYAHTFVRESFRIAGIRYFVPKMASRLSERAAFQTTSLPRLTSRPHLSAYLRIFACGFLLAGFGRQHRQRGQRADSELDVVWRQQQIQLLPAWRLVATWELLTRSLWWARLTILACKVDYFGLQDWLSWLARLTILACKIDYFGL